MSGFDKSPEENYQEAREVANQVGILLSGGYRVSLEELVAAYNQLAEIRDRLVADIARATARKQSNTTALQQMIADVSGIGPDADAVLRMVHTTATTAYTGKASFYQNQRDICNLLGWYMYHIWNTIKDYADAENRVVESLAKIDPQPGG